MIDFKVEINLDEIETELNTIVQAITEQEINEKLPLRQRYGFQREKFDIHYGSRYKGMK